MKRDRRVGGRGTSEPCTSNRRQPVAGAPPRSIASFDVFETLLYRVIGHHDTTHLLLGRVARARGIVRQDAAVVAAARRQAEMRARRRAGDVEIRFAAIHEELADGLGYDGARLEQMAALELELEARTIRSHVRAGAMVARARARGERIVFISDTYLPEAFVRRLLREHALWQDGDGLFVSSAGDGATKRSGRLFEVVAGTERVRPTSIAHTGNDWTADVLMARRRGVRARHFPQGNLNRYEEALERWSTRTAGLTSVLAGASRLARLEEPSPATVRSVTLRDTAAGVAAPLVIGFVLWLLDRAHQDGVEKLYFLAREGQLLYHAARQLQHHVPWDVELHYLHVSRQSLNLAVSGEFTRSGLAWVLSHAETNSIRTILARLGNRPEQIAAALEADGFRRDRWEDPVGTDDLPRLLGVLTRPDVGERLAPARDEARRLAVAYLTQEGVLGPDRVGLVDTTGRGSQLHAVHRLRDERSLPAPHGYLMVRSAGASAPESGDRDLVRAWFGDDTRGRGYASSAGRAALIEVICAADHGTTLGYERDGDRIRPRLAPGQERAALQWGLPVVRSTVMEVIDALCLDADLVDLEVDVRPAIDDVLTLLWDTPTTAESRVWGRFPFEATSGHGDPPTPLAAGYRLDEVATAVRRRELRDRHWFEWSAASEQLSPPIAAAVIRLARFVKHRARRVPRRVRDLVIARDWRTTP